MQKYQQRTDLYRDVTFILCCYGNSKTQCRVPALKIIHHAWRPAWRHCFC